MPAHSWKQQLSTAALCSLLLCVTIVNAAPELTTVASSTTTNSSSNNSTNFDCPTDCQCVLLHNTHKPLLHAKCSSIDDLRSETPLQATLPIHSIDLSYLALSRLSHSLEKLHDLTSVDLSHNELHEIGHLGRRIKKLNLKHNRLTSSKLSKLPQHVQVLNLQHNDITYLPLEFTKLAQLQSLELSHNQINCSCETLDVRNWLQERHVFMEHPVKCAFPSEFKGKSWLQLKQSDICAKEKNGWYAGTADENELMLGDQPVEGSGDEHDDEEELGKAFMPIDRKQAKSSELSQQYSDVEGSGDLSEMNLPLELASTMAPAMLLARAPEETTTELPAEEQEEEEEDGSGSGGGMLFIPHLQRGAMILDDFDAPDSNDDTADADNKPVPAPAAEPTISPTIFGNSMGIFDGDEERKPVVEEEIVPAVFHEENAAAPDGDLTGDTIDGDLSADPSVLHADLSPKDDSSATYLLLGIIALIVVGLLLFVGIKRCKHNRALAHDAENPRSTELLDMDKKNLGKPMHQHEHAPLIGEKTKSDMAKPINGAGNKPYSNNDVKDSPTQQQPLLNGNGTTNGNAATESNNNNDEVPKIAEPNTETAPHEYYPITSRYPPPKSPRASKYAQHPQGEPNNNNDEVFLPSSPQSGRYSPVYSPETGRVKIRLTETPKPKTPMLVTRSKSNAGEMITTPVRATNLGVPEVHVGGTANGQLSH